MSSCGCFWESKKCFTRHLLRRAPRLVNTAMTSRVSTRTSRSAGSLTTAAAVDGAAGGTFVAATGADAPPLGGAAGVAPRPSAVGDWVVPAAGFGTGLTNIASHG